MLDSAVGVLNTTFDANTKLVNTGESNPSAVVPTAELLDGDAGLAYVDVQLALGGGG